MVSMTRSPDSTWNQFQWQRHVETFSSLNDSPVIAKGASGQDNICMPGELTDKGRETTYALGQRLRALYIDRLGLLAPRIHNSDDIYLRSTPLPRALESLQQVFRGMFPETSDPSFTPVKIVLRTPVEEQLYPNEESCPRLLQLMHAFADRTAERHNNSTDMDYVTSRIGKWMTGARNKVAVDSRPRLSGIMDTINSTLAHGPETRLPDDFYDQKSREIIERIGMEEWFVGYKESQEFRALGSGSALADVVSRMMNSTKVNGSSHKPIRLGLQGCHDTTIAAAMSSLGAFENELWPPYTSHVAFELFKDKGRDTLTASNVTKQASWTTTFFGRLLNKQPQVAARKSLDELSEMEKSELEGYYVRLRYNDKVKTIPGCKLPGNHLEGDDSFCTLVS